MSRETNRAPEQLTKGERRAPEVDYVEAEHDPAASRRASNAAMQRMLGPYIQRKAAAAAAASTEATHAAAAQGTQTPARPLPHADRIQAAFGPAHDVSKIRAHIDPASAQAMGAEAYASGNDVVFAKEPDVATASHEAAHVVQQAQGVNLKGGVGEAGDAHEQNADAVADRVVAGQSAAPLLGGFAPFQGGGIATQVQQKKCGEEPGMTIEATDSMPHEEYRDAADAGEQEEQQSLAQQEQKKSTTPIVLQIGNAGERAAAQRKIDEINGYREHLLQGIHDGLIPPDALTTNTKATLALGDFLVSAGEQGRTLTDFQRAYRTAKTDTARFTSQLALVQKQNPGLQGNLIDEWGGEKQIQKNAASVSAEGQGQGGIHWASMQSQHAQLEQEVALAAAAQNDTRASRAKVSVALNDIEGGIPTTEQSSAEGHDILEQTGMIKKVIGLGIDKAFDFFKIPGSEIATRAAEAVVDEIFSGELRVLDAKTKETADKQKHGVGRSQVESLRAALATWVSDMIRCYAAQQHVTTLKSGMRDSSRQFAAAADDKGQFEVGIIAEMYAEADTLLQQISLAIGLGQAEHAAADGAKQDRNTLVGDKQGLTYYEPDKTYTIRMKSLVDPRSVGWSYDAIEHHIYFSASGVGGTEGDGGVNPVMTAAIADLVSARATVQTSRDRLASALGFSKESDQHVPGAAAKGPQ